MSLLPDRKNFTIWKGGTFRKVLTMHQGATTTTPVYNFTGFTARMRLRDENGVTIQTLTTENGGIILGGTAGTITIYISDEATLVLPWEVALYELFLITPSGDADPILHGTLRVTGAG